MRLFVAIVPPAGALAELAAAVGECGDAPAVRWSPPEQWHLTLAFLGEVDDRTREELAERLGRAARRHPPLALALGGGGRFGSRVLWTGVDGDRTGLRRLGDSVRAAVRRCGLPAEDRPYRPHLTLARGRPGADLTPLVARLAAFRGSPWQARELQLVRSELGAGPGGTARYSRQASWPLTGALPPPAPGRSSGARTAARGGGEAS